MIEFINISNSQCTNAVVSQSELLIPTKQKHIILIDAFAYIFRAFYGLPDLRTQAGQPTGAVRGMVLTINKLKKEYPDALLVMVYDTPGKTFRDELYAEYKAHRPPMPDDLKLQIEPIRDCTEALGIPAIELEGYEADDIIGTVAAKANAECQVTIASGDKDMAQLVGDFVNQYNPLKNQLLGAKDIEEAFGIPPHLIIDYLAIVGDSADNIPGIKGVGPKTAVPLLQEFGSVEQIYSNLDKIATLSFRGAKKLADKIAPLQQDAELSKKLATIDTNVPLTTDIEQLQLQPINVNQLKQLYQQLEFNQLLLDLEKNASDNKTNDPAEKKHNSNYQCIDSIADWQALVVAVKQSQLFAIDTETNSLDTITADLIGLSIATKSGKIAYIPLLHDQGKQLTLEQILPDLQEILADDSLTKVGQNLKFDMKVLAKYGCVFKGVCFDTMLMAHLLDSNQRSDLDSLAKKHLQYQCTSFKDIAGSGKNQLTFNQIAIDVATQYAAEDADITLQLFNLFQQQLLKQPKLLDLYATIDLPIVSILAKMENNGVLVDTEQLNTLSDEFAIEIAAIQKQAHSLAGIDFNLASPSQIGQVLFQTLQLPVLKKTPKKEPSTSEEVLEKLSEYHPLPEIILRHRSLAKLRSTYTTKLVAAIHPKTGRVHSSFHQAVASTGRLSSTDPNVQNIPIRTSDGNRIRKAFISQKGFQILAADYSQIELRIMAHLSRDKNLVSAIVQGEDVHASTASEIFEVPISAVDAAMRRRAKAVNFGLIYGMSAFGLAKQLGETQKQAKQYIELYFNRYPGVKQYMEQIREVAREQGYVETILGRQIQLPYIKDKNFNLRSMAERVAINAPMQGSAADIIKLAMIDIDTYLTDNHLKTLMTMQVHDELVFEVPTDEIKTVPTEIKTRMEAVLKDKLDVPLLVEFDIANNWCDAH